MRRAERHLQDVQDEFHSFISRKHFEQTVTGQNNKPEEREDKNQVSASVYQRLESQNVPKLKAANTKNFLVVLKITLLCEDCLNDPFTSSTYYCSFFSVKQCVGCFLTCRWL